MPRSVTYIVLYALVSVINIGQSYLESSVNNPRIECQALNLYIEANYIQGSS